MDRRSTAGALLALAACIACVSAAPRYSDSTALDLHESGESSDGCYYNFQHYGEGDRIMTNEPCLNCTCHNRMLMCYLRVCPFTKPIGQDCTIEKRADQCCPIITCPDVPVDLLTSTSTTSPAEYGMTGVGHLDKYGCSINEKFYPEGAKVPPMPNKPCEHCYCIRNMTTCVMQECTLHVDGCTPIYHKDVCCPVRYSCDHTDDLPLMLDHTTTTEGTTPGFQWTTTVAPSVKVDCVHGDDTFSDGALIKTEKACEHCYCMKGDIVCVVQECGTPMENEGKNCTSLPPREGQCCPDTYICEGDSEVTTEPPRRLFDKDGIDYRVDHKNEFTTEGSGFSDVTDEPMLNTEDSIFKMTENPEDETSYTVLNKITDEPESATIYDLSTIKEDKEEDYHTTISSVPDEHVTEDNLSTINEVSIKETSHTTVSSVLDEHVTEDNLSTMKDIPDKEISHTTLSITNVPEQVTEESLSTIREVEKEGTSSTVLSIITEHAEYVTEDNLPSITETPEEDKYLITDKPEHITENNLSTIKDVPKEETTLPTFSSITEKSEHATEDYLSTTIKEVTKEEISHTTLSSITEKSEYAPEDNLSTAIKEVPEEEISQTTLSSITEKSEYANEDNLSTIKEVPEEETLSTTFSSVTEEAEHITEYSPVITKAPAEETSHILLTQVTDGLEYATEDNASTIKEIHKEEDISPTTLSSVTEDNLYTINDVPTEESSHTILNSVTEKPKHVTVDDLPLITGDSKDEISYTTMRTVTDASEYTKQDYMSTKVSTKETSYSTLSSVIEDHDHTEESISIVTEVPKEEISHTTLSSVTDLPHSNTDDILLPTTSSVDGTEVPKEETSHTVSSSGEPELITDDYLSHTTLSSVTKKDEHSTDDIPAITEVVEKEISYTTLSPITDEPVQATEDTLSTINEIPKKDHITISSIHEKVSETTIPTIKENDDVMKTTSSVIETTTHIEYPPPTDYTTSSQDIDHSNITDKVDYSTIKPDINDDDHKTPYLPTSEKSITSANADDDTSAAITENELIKEGTTINSESTYNYQSTEKVTYPIIDDEEKYFTDVKVTTIQEPNKTEITKTPKEELFTESTTYYEKYSTSILGESSSPKATEKTTAITGQVYSETTSIEKDDEFTTDSDLKEEYEATTSKSEEEVFNTNTLIPEEHTKIEDLTTVPKEVEYEQSTSGNVDEVTEFGITHKESDIDKTQHTTSLLLDSSTDKISYEKPDKDLNTILPEIQEKDDISTTEHIKLSTVINDSEKYTTLPSQEIFTSKVPDISLDTTKDVDRETEISKATTESSFTEKENITKDDILHESSTMVSPSENEVYDENKIPNKVEKDSDNTKSTTMKTEPDYTTKSSEEPDKGLNTVPVEPLGEETGKITTESNQKDQISSEATVTESVTEQHIIKEDEKLDTPFDDKFITSTTVEFDKKVETEHPHYQTVDTDMTQHDIELTTSSLDVLKDVTTEFSELQTTVITEFTTEKIEDLTENEIPEEHGPHIQSPGIIPGEGSCLIEGVTYNNYSIVPSTNKCQSNCKCISSIVKCDAIHCSPPPEYMINCQPVYDATDSCCPSYVCDDSKETIPPQPHSQMSVTESSPSVECRENCQTDTTSKPDKKCTDKECEVKEDDIIPVKQSELCSSGKCTSSNSDISSTEPSSITQNEASGCVGTNCESESSAPETSLTDISNQFESSTKKVDVECTGDTCSVKHITPDKEVRPADCLPGKCETDIKPNELPKDEHTESSCFGNSCDHNVDLTTQNVLVPIDKNLTNEEYTTVSSKSDETSPYITKDSDDISLSTEEQHVTDHTMTTIDIHNKKEHPVEETNIPKLSTLSSLPNELEITTHDSISTQSPELIETSRPEEVIQHDTNSGEIVTIIPDLKTTTMSLESKATESPYTVEYTQYEDEIKTKSTSKYDDTEENTTHHRVDVESGDVSTEADIYETSEPSKTVTNVHTDEITTTIPSKIYPEITAQTEEITTNLITKLSETTEKHIDDEKTETTTPYFVELIEHPHMIDETEDVTTEDENIMTTITNIEEDKILTKLTTVIPDISSSTEHIDEGLNTIQPDYSADHTLDYESTNLPDEQSTSTEKHNIKHDEFVTSTTKDISSTEIPVIPEITHTNQAQTSTTESKPHDIISEIPITTENQIFDGEKQTTSPTIHLSSKNDDTYIHSTTDEYYTTSSLPGSETTTIDDVHRKTSQSQETEFSTSTLKPITDIPEYSVTENLKPTSNTEAVTENNFELEHISESLDEIKNENETSPTLTTADDSIIVFVDDDNDTDVSHHKKVTTTSKITTNEQTTSKNYISEHITTQGITEQTYLDESTFHDHIETTSTKPYESETSKFTDGTEDSLSSKDREEMFNKETTTLPPYIEKETTAYEIHDIHEETSTYVPKIDDVSHVTTKLPIEDTSEDMLAKSTPQIVSDRQTTIGNNVYDETTANVEYTKYTSPKEDDFKKETTVQPYIVQETTDTGKPQVMTEDTIYKTESTTKVNTEQDLITQGLYEEHTTDNLIKDEITEAPTTFKPHHVTTENELHLEISTTVKEIATEKSPNESKTTIGELVPEIISTDKVIDKYHEDSTSIKPHFDTSSIVVDESNEAFTTYKPTTILSDDLTTTKMQEDKYTPIEIATPKLVTEYVTEHSPEEIITQDEIKSSSEGTTILETETSIPIKEVTVDKQQPDITVSISTESPEKVTYQESTTGEDILKHTTTIPNKYDDESVSSEVPSESHPTDVPKPLVTQKPDEETSSSVDDSDQQSQEFPSSGTGGYGQETDYGEDDQAFGPGTCRYGGKVYVSAQQIPRDDPCDFCFCFRSDIICLQQSCPPPIHGCHEEPIQGFCCPRYECPVSMGTSLNMTTTTTTTTTTLPPHFLPHAYKGAAQRKGCQIKGHSYQVGEVVRASSGPCLHCTCGGDGQMKCDPKACTPEPMLRQMIAAAVASKRRR